MASLEHLKVAEREHKAGKAESESETVVLRESGLFPILGGSIADVTASFAVSSAMRMLASKLGMLIDRSIGYHQRRVRFGDIENQTRGDHARLLEIGCLRRASTTPNSQLVHRTAGS